MQRAFELAGKGSGYVSPNPMVGCVILSDGKIIGEGWHKRFGKGHAEVEAVSDAISRGHSDLLKGATAYVTLEPCSHHGKTPPCVDLLISKGVANVVVANEDPNPLVNGRGLERLRQAGIVVASGVMDGVGEVLNKRFLLRMRQQRPFVILKWAQSRDGYLSLPGERIRISDSLTDVLVHKWRSEEDAILVGKNTVEIDNPKLNVRHWSGYDPVRVVLDRNLSTASHNYFVFDRTQPTVFVNQQKETPFSGPQARYSEYPEQGFPVGYLQVSNDEGVREILNKLYLSGIGSVLVEGGASVLYSFLQAGLWDEIRIISGDIKLGRGITAPRPEGTFVREENIGKDIISYFTSPK
jgi:diaminohydroxyphosphoribosylaminopyrimidine deaminase/5-amino-6-(5-phosphoribosylamino)uracil reductase